MAARSLTRFLPLALAGAAAASVWMFWDVPWRRAEPEVCALLAAAVLGGASTALRAKGWKRTARALAGAVLVGALGLVAHRVDAGSGWVDLADQLVTITGPLAIATFALVGTRDSAGFALGAALVAVVTPWYFWAMPALLVLGFVFGRDALSGRSPRNAISTAGAGALAMLLVTAIGFDLGAFLVDTYRPGMMSLRGYVDGPLTFVPRVAVEGALLAGCLALARGRAWGLLALMAIAPVLVLLTKVDGQLPVVSMGCVSWGHPFVSLGYEIELFHVAFALAIAPWVGPVVRALRCRL